MENFNDLVGNEQQEAIHIIPDHCDESETETSTLTEIQEKQVMCSASVDSSVVGSQSNDDYGVGKKEMTKNLGILKDVAREFCRIGSICVNEEAGEVKNSLSSFVRKRKLSDGGPDADRSLDEMERSIWIQAERMKRAATLLVHVEILQEQFLREIYDIEMPLDA